MSGRLGRTLYHLAGWKRARLGALRRAGYRCQRCGGARRLEVHHRTPIEQGGAPFDPRNLEVCCRGCHFAAHGKAAPPATPPDTGRLARERREWRRFLDNKVSA